MVSWNRWESCVTMPMRAASEAKVASRRSMPLMEMAPPFTSYSRASSWVMVVLPAPDGPTSAVRVPGATSKSISVSTVFSGCREGDLATASSEASETSAAGG